MDDQPHSAIHVRVGGGEGPPTKAINRDTVRLAIRLRARTISCSFGVSQLAERQRATAMAVVFAKTCELGLEGIVSKRAGSFYESGL